ncbi:Protein CBG18937 [Caenorhabditis briggsae]|uniref:Protein CBG18937 n=2 Tax=Caenorhabditis briggsae TaxID=6238 RepID=A8XUE1_CAEBR|nr:Protein CBG18937 [Caenorhabditis briggsae]ULT90260.1 hypothetical protein L3Y34_008546 [Caenorhabditis briggsae]CAP36266.1 Protein CBG18937 [Caenorhabditis briggsae]
MSAQAALLSLRSFYLFSGWPEVDFVNPTTGVHTQRVESLWSQLKKEIKPKCGLRGDNWDDHWFQALWMFKYHEESKFYELWKQISEKYPLN